MLLIVVPVGAGVGAGDGAGVGAGFGLGPEPVVGEGVDAAGVELDAGTVALLLVGAEAVPPHPEIAKRRTADRQKLKSAGGTKRISRF